VTEATFRDLIPYTFTTTSSDGRVVELLPDGEHRPVEWHTRHLFVSLTKQYRLNEFQQQIRAIRRGLQLVVPVRFLHFFTGSQVERLVCGTSTIDIDTLKAHTRYVGYSATDQVIRWFWEVMEGFPQRERQLFLRFAWGRSRLPLRSAGQWEQEMEIQRPYHHDRRPPRFHPGPPGAAAAAGVPHVDEGDVGDAGGPSSSAAGGGGGVAPRREDTMLPSSHTCFFQVDLPAYSSAAILRQKLLYAITEGIAIDADHAAQDINWENVT